MKIWTALLYGILQGLTEFLPVSSSGHLAIMQNILHMENVEANYLSFDILLHLATLLAVFVLYWRDIFALIPAFFTLLKKVFTGKCKLAELTVAERMVLLVIIATLPLVLAVFVKDYVELLYGYTQIIGAILIFNGALLILSDHVSRIKQGKKTVKDATPLNALSVGLCQCCALLPGLSRSGSTITGGLLCGFDRQFAVKFSFILSVPAILGANILNIKDMFDNPVPSSDILPYLLGTLAAAVTGILAMKLLIWISKKSNFTWFGYYCLAIGALAVIFG